MRHLDLCSGYGAGALVFGEPAAFGEIDPSACKVLAARFPSVPNLGDVKRIGWESLGPIDSLSAGYPCQPFSTAGRRKGEDDPRHLWPAIARGIGALRPRVAYLENVRGHLSLGFLRVLGDLADMGYDARWGVVSAAEVGACHRRERLWVVATDAGRPGCGILPQLDGDQVHDLIGSQWLHSDGRAGAEGMKLLPTPAAGQHNYDEDPESWFARREELKAKGINGNGAGMPLGIAVKLLPTPMASDANGEGGHGEGGPDLRTAVARSVQVQELSQAHKQPCAGLSAPDRWGDYAAAIARHEAVFGREAPEPLVGKSLSPRFVEWMMMLPEGWVADVDISRTAQVRILGNGWVPRQAAAAWQLLASSKEVAA